MRSQKSPPRFFDDFLAFEKAGTKWGDRVDRRWLSRDPLGEYAGINLYGYVGDDPINWGDPFGLCTYRVNRELGGGPAMPGWDPLSHTFIFTIDPKGIVHTFSWGNTGNSHGWNQDRPEDVVAAFQAIDDGYAKYEGNNSLDPFIQQAFDSLKNPAFNHPNYCIAGNCKTGATNLVEVARMLQADSIQNGVGGGGNGAGGGTCP